MTAPIPTNNAIPSLAQLGVDAVCQVPEAACEPRRILFPKECFVGPLGEFAQVMSDNSQVPPEFFYAAGLTMFGAMVSTKVKLAIRFDVEPRLYTVLLGQSGMVKKSTAMKQTIRFFQSLKGGASYVSVCNGVGSGEGLASALNEAPRGRMVLAYDELRGLIDKCAITGSSLLSSVTSLYEQTELQNQIKSKSHSVLCKDAHLAVLGCCTTETYNHIWSSAAIGIGLLNRLFVVMADGGKIVAWPDEIPEANVDRLRGYFEGYLQRAHRDQDGIKFDRTPEAQALWEKWCERLRPSAHATRLDTIGFKIMGPLALLMERKAIDAEVMGVVCKLLDYELDVRTITDPIDADSIIARLEESVRRHLHIKGSLTKNQLRQSTSADKHGVWMFEQALNNLLRIEDVVIQAGKYTLTAQGRGE
ncbi:MAG TPA: DUF3987 domain-containing protein [Bryobacteraceae bacterium]|nr:DUF3987 domain-containing protein [Bryobacteraceae bacterium]